MMHILMVSEKPSGLDALREGLLKQPQVQVDVVASVDEAMVRINEALPALVVMDEIVGGVPGKNLIEGMIKKNPFINTALVSPLSPEDFHEHTEGLGILMKVDKHAGESQAKDMVEQLQKLLSLYK
jgi:DNA-binding NtrC family response regulator